MPAAGRVIIIGGGIGGLAAAVGLRRIGMETAVFERAPEIREVGAGISMWCNAVRAARRLGVADRILQLGSPVGRAVTYDSRGRILSQTDIAAMSAEAGEPSLGIHRADIQRTLLEALPAGSVFTGRECVGFEQTESRVTAKFADGTTETGDILIGADGIRSAVRRGLMPVEEPRYAGYVAWRGIATHPDPNSLMPATDLVFAVGKGAQVGVSHCGPGRIYWFATKNMPAGSPDTPGRHRGELLSIFGGWCAPIPQVLAATEEPAMFRNDIIDRPPTWPWGAGRVTLVGDAIHPTTPNLGQGACQAIEDAVFLADSLRRAADAPAGLRDFEQRRRERTALVTNESWKFGKVLQWRNPVAVWFRNFLLRRKFAQRQGEQLFRTMFSHPLPELPQELESARMPAITVRNLAKTYRVAKRKAGLTGAFKALFSREYEVIRAVDDISFSIEPGEFVGFLGPNGAGKTTTLKMLAGLITPDSGDAAVLGHVPWRREDDYKRSFSLVMGQKNQLWWDLPAGDSFVLNKEIYGIDGPTYERVLGGLLELLAVKDKVGVPVRELSLGERMKMELIAALLHSPKVLFLDEPTIGLDVVAQSNIRQCLRDYNRERGVTVLLTSHYMKDIQALCPRLVVINHGKIVHDGSLSGVLDKFGRHKLIKVRFAEGVVPFEPAGVGRSTGGTGPERIYEVDREQVTRFAQDLLSRPGVEDIAIEEPPLEDVIAQVFQGSSPEPGA